MLPNMSVVWNSWQPKQTYLQLFKLCKLKSIGFSFYRSPKEFRAVVYSFSNPRGRCFAQSQSEFGSQSNNDSNLFLIFKKQHSENDMVQVAANTKVSPYSLMTEQDCLFKLTKSRNIFQLQLSSWANGLQVDIFMTILPRQAFNLLLFSSVIFVLQLCLPMQYRD